MTSPRPPAPDGRRGDATDPSPPEADPTARAAPGGVNPPERTRANGEGPAVGTRLSAAEIHDNVRLAAEEELERPGAALLWSALAAGLTIGFSFVAGGYATTLVPAAYDHAIASAVYPIGFIFVVLARQQLFTENTLEPIIPLLSDFTWRMWGRVVRLWAIVLGANLVGTLLFAFFAARTPMFDSGVLASMDALAEHATSGGFALVLYRAVFAGWLIALMAWLVASTRETFAQILLVWLTTAPIAAFGFRHSIAGSAEAFYRALRGLASWESMIVDFLVPAVLGNVVGGVLLVALLNHGQVAADRKVLREKGLVGGLRRRSGDRE